MTAVVHRPVRSFPALPGAWLRDLTLGLRLAVGGGRNSVTRIVLSTVGVGMAVAVLLLGASATNVIDQHEARSAAATPIDKPVPGVAPLQLVTQADTFRGQEIDGNWVHATGRNSPMPPGVTRLPRPGEVLLSPALAALLDSPQGVLLRPRFPEHVIGTIGAAGVLDPQQLSFYAGADDFGPVTGPDSGGEVDSVYRFGEPAGSHGQTPEFALLIALGAVALLIPILLFVAVTSRIAGAQRDRRLAALRLVGASGRQVRRIAAAESLVPAALGLLLGTGLFLLARQAAGGVDLFGLSVYTQDLVPPWPLAVLVLLVVPVLAVGSSLFAMRRTVIEPLGVLRMGKPVRRRMWWRLALIVLGVVALLIDDRHNVGNQLSIVLIVVGAALLLIGVPVVLPWLLERVVGLLRGGPPSWQLAVRRLQLDSGTPARVVGGVAVVLASAIAVQTVFFGAFQLFQAPQDQAAADSGLITVESDPGVAGELGTALSAVPGARSLGSFDRVGAVMAGSTSYTEVDVASCALIEAVTNVTGCTDGQAFRMNGPEASYYGQSEKPGTRLSLIADDVDPAHAVPVGTWTVPAGLRTATSRGSDEDTWFYGLVVTPGAIAGATLPADHSVLNLLRAAPNHPDELEYVRNAVAPFTWHAEVETFTDEELTADQATFRTIEDALLAGSLFTLGIAGVSMLVLALEQVRERRRPLAALAAAGVPRAVLARSLLWQTAVPVGIGVVVALATGIGLAALMLRLGSFPFALDWTIIGVFAGATVVLVLLVTALTLPALRGATRLTALRTE